MQPQRGCANIAVSWASFRKSIPPTGIRCFKISCAIWSIVTFRMIARAFSVYKDDRHADHKRMEQRTTIIEIKGHGEILTGQERIPVSYRFVTAVLMFVQDREVKESRRSKTCGTIFRLDEKQQAIPAGVWSLLMQGGDRWSVHMCDGLWGRVELPEVAEPGSIGSHR